jgi:hypothetical protein
VQFLLESGFNCLKPFKEPVPPSAAENNSDGEDRWAGRKAERLRKEQEEFVRPGSCETSLARTSSKENLSVFQRFLDSGANIFLPFNRYEPAW